MEEFKAFWQSKTVWGAAVALLSSAVGLGHYTMSTADAAQAVDLMTSIATAIGGLVAIYGRVVATKQIKASS